MLSILHSIIKHTGRLGLAGVCTLLVATGTARAQDSFTYSQYMNNLTPVNPAYSLLDQNGSISGLYRSQWTGIEGAPSTFIFNASVPIENINGTVGLTALNDQFAVEHLTEVNAFVAKGIQISQQMYLGVAINAGIRRYVANYSSLSAIDPSFRDDVRQAQPNVGFSVMLYAPNYYLGFALPEMTIASLGNASAQENNYFKSHFNISGAYLIDNGSEDFKLKPAILAYYTKGEPLTANFSATVYVKDLLGLGAGYRTNKQLSGILSINSRNIRLGYSYQFAATGMNFGGVSSAVHEVTLSYRFGKHLDQISLL